MAFDVKPGPPHDLTVPREGSTTAHGVLSMAIRRAFEDLKVLRPPAGVSEPVQEGYRALRSVVAETFRQTPGPVAATMRRPTVAAPLRCARDGSADPELAFGELTMQALFELALAEVLPREVTVGRLAPRLLSPAHGRCVEVPEQVARVTFGSGRVAFDGDDVDLDAAEHARGYHPVEGDLVLALVDNNPLSMFEAHPDKEGNAIDLGGKSVEQWVTALRDALELLQEHAPDLRREMGFVVRQLVPVGYDEEKHLSASYKEALGTIYLSLHPQLMTMAEALIHEMSHNKVNALLELDPLLHNAFHPLYRSPVRPDPRPLHGVLLAVHAFLPVARLYEAMTEAGHPLSRRPDFQRRFAEIVANNREGAAVLLEHGEPTAVGSGLMDEIRRWDAHFRGAQPAPAE